MITQNKLNNIFEATLKFSQKMSVWNVNASKLLVDCLKEECSVLKKKLYG